MQDIEALASTWHRGAIVTIHSSGGSMTRPAAFVYATPRGFAWIEPSYADPYGASSSALHFRDGEPQATARGGFELVTRNNERINVEPYGATGPLEDGALNWFAAHLAEKHIDWAAERERLRVHLDQV